MKQIKWFERKFNFDFNENIFPGIIERLQGTPIRIEDKISRFRPATLKIKHNGKWSVAEHIGHLIDLEPLWQGRLEDIINGNETLRPADLENKKTENADHNSKSIKDLLSNFRSIRSQTIKMIENLDDKTIFKSALHPRLKIPMRTMDLFLFVAEHDDHHLASISEINRNINTA